MRIPRRTAARTCARSSWSLPARRRFSSSSACRSSPAPDRLSSSSRRTSRSRVSSAARSPSRPSRRRFSAMSAAWLARSSRRRPILRGQGGAVDRLDPPDLVSVRPHRAAGAETADRDADRSATPRRLSHLGGIHARRREDLAGNLLAEAPGRARGTQPEPRAEQPLLARVRGAHPVAEVARRAADGEEDEASDERRRACPAQDVRAGPHTTWPRWPAARRRSRRARRARAPPARSARRRGTPSPSVASSARTMDANTATNRTAAPLSTSGRRSGQRRTRSPSGAGVEWIDCMFHRG